MSDLMRDTEGSVWNYKKECSRMSIPNGQLVDKTVVADLTAKLEEYNATNQRFVAKNHRLREALEEAKTLLLEKYEFEAAAKLCAALTGQQEDQEPTGDVSDV
jgi:hypothetical protein